MVAHLNRIYLSAPDVGVEEEKAAIRAIRSGWVAPIGPEIDGFEADVSALVGSPFAVALSSGTAALHLGLKAIGVRPGDSVITPSMTFVATANAVTYLGATPVFVDSREDGLLDPELVKMAFELEYSQGRRVGAVIPVDLYGQVADYSVILPIAESEGVPVLADSAEALGASHAGKAAGSWGDAAVLSFNGNKILTTSGGGMLITSDPEKAQYVRYLATQAREPVAHYEHTEVGYNYRMSNVCAAIGRAQLGRLPAMIARRKAIRLRYLDFFSRVTGVTILSGNSGEENFWLTSIRVDPSVSGWSVLELRKHLEELNIESRPLWKPMHLQPLYSGARFVGGHVAERLFETGLALPSGSAMSDSDMDRVLDAISAFLNTR